MVTVAASRNLDIKYVFVQTIFPGKSVHFEFELTPNGIDPRMCAVQLANRAKAFLRENNWTFDGITLKEGSLDFEHPRVEDFDDETCWLEINFIPT